VAVSALYFAASWALNRLYRLHQTGTHVWSMLYRLVWSVCDIVQWATVPFFLFAVAMFGWCTFRSTAIARHVRPEVAGLSPFLAVGWYVIPVVNLWKPFMGMRRVWRIAFHEHAVSSSYPLTMAGWWICWVLYELLFVFGFVASLVSYSSGSEESGLDRLAPGLSFLSDQLSTVVAALAAIFALSFLPKLMSALDVAPEASSFA
jgi:hypothetical protein